MRLIRGKFTILISVLLLSTGCAAAELLPTRQNHAASVPVQSSATVQESSSSEEASSGRALETSGQVVLYRKLGDNPATKVESVAYDHSLYQPNSSGNELMEQWGLSQSVYVFIGWFYLDENNRPAEWTGDQNIPVQADKETAIAAVFNIYYRKTDRSRGGTLELYCATNGNAPVLANRILGVSDYPLPATPDAILQDDLPSAQQPVHFDGWFTADSTGKPLTKLEDTHVRLNKKETLQITAVFSNAP